MLAKTSLLALYDTDALAWDDPRLPPVTRSWLHLRQVTIPWMEAHPERVDLDYLVSSCGTYACLAGWDATLRDPLVPVYEAMLLDGHYRHFGASVIASRDPIFGVAAVGTLAQRAERIDVIIRDRLAELDKTEQGN